MTSSERAFTARFLEPYQPENLRECVEHVVSNGLLREGNRCYSFEGREKDKDTLMGLRYALACMVYHTSSEATVRNEALGQQRKAAGYFIRDRLRAFSDRVSRETMDFIIDARAAQFFITQLS